MAQSTPLCEIMTRHGSDKGTWHNYTIFYYDLFKEIRDKDLRVFELGLGQVNAGASLRGWAEFFPNARVYGADILRHLLFQTDRIKTFHCDQTDPASIEQLWRESDLLAGFDIIVEDGLHTFEANKTFFEHSIHKLNAGGYFIIEDILEGNLSRFDQQVEQWGQEFPDLDFTVMRIPLHTNTFDNNLVVIHRKPQEALATRRTSTAR